MDFRRTMGVICSSCLTALAATALLLVALPAQAQGDAPRAIQATGATASSAWVRPADGSIVLFRHAQAPGVGDPARFDLGDCTTQRNLSAAGRAQAEAIGKRLRAAGAVVSQVLSSRWCRTRETAELAFPGQVRAEPLFDSFFAKRERADPQTDKARQFLLQWRGPGVLVVVTHQVNITQLTSVYPSSGEGVVLKPQGDRLAVVGQLEP